MLPVAFALLVPLITGLDANTALLTAGIGTLLFPTMYRQEKPIFLPLLCFYCTNPIWCSLMGNSATMGGLAWQDLFMLPLSLLVKITWSGGLTESFSLRLLLDPLLSLSD